MIHQPREVLAQRVHEVPLRLFDRRRVDEYLREPLDDSEKGRGVRLTLAPFQDAQSKLEHRPLADTWPLSKLERL